MVLGSSYFLTLPPSIHSLSWDSSFLRRIYPSWYLDGNFWAINKRKIKPNDALAVNFTLRQGGWRS